MPRLVPLRRTDATAAAPRPLLGRDAWRFGARAGGIAGFVFGLLLVTGHVARNRSDAPFFEGVARNPFADGRHLTTDPALYGVAYRFGRVLYSFVAWALALGQHPLVRPALAVVFLGSVVAFAAAGHELVARAGAPRRRAALLFAAPFTLIWFATGVLVSEPFVLALLLLALLADADGRDRPARLLATAALLAREAMLVPLLAIPLHAARRDGVAVTVRRWWWVPVPYALWATWVKLRVGDFPFLDPSASRRQATSLPFAGMARAFSDPGGDTRAAVVVGVATLVVGVVVLARARRGAWSTVATATALSLASVACYGPFVWGWLGECVRVLASTHVLLILTALTQQGHGDPAVSRHRAAPA